MNTPDDREFAYWRSRPAEVALDQDAMASERMLQIRPPDRNDPVPLPERMARGLEKFRGQVLLVISGDDLTPAEKKALGISENQLAVRQDKFVHSTLKAVGMKAGDVIVALNGKPVDGSMDDFLGRVRRDHLVGDVVEITVLRDGTPAVLKVTLK